MKIHASCQPFIPSGISPDNRERTLFSFLKIHAKHDEQVPLMPILFHEENRLTSSFIKGKVLTLTFGI
jgi:hypothetical protein